MSLKHKILARISEPYRIRNGWGLSPIRNKRELKALIKFCEEQLEDKKLMRLNLHLEELYSLTVKIYYEYPKLTDGMLEVYKYNGRRYYDVYTLIKDNARYYWS